MPRNYAIKASSSSDTSKYLDSLLEPKKVSSPSPDFTSYVHQYDSSTVQNVAGHFQAKPTNSWAQGVETGYYYQDNQVVCCAIGCFPYPTAFATITSGTDLAITRTDSALTIGSTSYAASTFRNGVVPKYIGVLLCGGGGGAGGRGCNKGDKNGYNVYTGGGGGGGGIASFVLKLPSYTLYLNIASGGAAGSNAGHSSSGNTYGGNGANGQDTVIYKSSSSDFVAKALGGTYGGGGNGAGGLGAKGYGNGTSWGSSYASSVYYDNQETAGGDGTGGDAAGTVSPVLTRGFAVTSSGTYSVTIKSSQNPGSTSYTSGDSYRNSYCDGGGSYGVCGKYNTSTTQTPGYGGGGGADGHGNQAGGGGLAIFYY